MSSSSHAAAAAFFLSLFPFFFFLLVFVVFCLFASHLLPTHRRRHAPLLALFSSHPSRCTAPTDTDPTCSPSRPSLPRDPIHLAPPTPPHLFQCPTSAPPSTVRPSALCAYPPALLLFEPWRRWQRSGCVFPNISASHFPLHIALSFFFCLPPFSSSPPSSAVHCFAHT